MKNDDYREDKSKPFDTDELLIEHNAKNILCNPSFFEIAIKELDIEVVGEIPTREVLFLCYSGRLVENAKKTSYNLLVNDETGVGKDFLVNAVGKLHIPESVFIKRTRISPKVLNYWHTTKKDIDEGWTWDGKILALEDTSYEVMNNEVMRTFLSSGSRTTILADQYAKELIVKGKPVVVFTTASVNPKQDMLRRMNIVNLDSSVDQTKEIAKRKCRLAKDGIVEEIDPAIILAISKLKRVKVKIPFGDKIADWIDKIPEENIKVLLRTQIETFLDYIKSATAIHQYQRDQDDDDYFLSTEQDYEIGKRCFEKMISNPFMIPLTKQQQKVKEVIKLLGGDKDWVKLPEVIEKITFWEERWSYKQINRLVDFGILSKEKEKYEDVDKPTTIIKISELIELKLPHFDEL